MKKFVLGTIAALLVLAGPVSAQQQTMDLLDVMIVKVRGDRTAEYEAAIKKLVDANRKHKGDTWLAMQTEYGEMGTLIFSSARPNLASIETAYGAFMKSMSQAYGQAGAEKLLQTLMGSSTSATTEIRRRRWDLSVHPPAGPEEMFKAVAQARWIRALKIDLKPGKVLDFAEAWKPLQAAFAGLSPNVSIWVSQSVTGPPAIYMGVLAKSLAELDAMDAVVAKVIQSETYRTYQRAAADSVAASKWEMYRFRPELSNVPDEIAAVAPDFWRPKPPPAPKK